MGPFQMISDFSFSDLSCIPVDSMELLFFPPRCNFKISLKFSVILGLTLYFITLCNSINQFFIYVKTC